MARQRPPSCSICARSSRIATSEFGYRSTSGEPISLIRQLQSVGTSDEFWEQMWNELHHQGDVGEASYAVVPYLVDYQGRRQHIDEQIFHFCVAVDLQRPENGNPPVPPELEFSYARAMRACLELSK